MQVSHGEKSQKMQYFTLKPCKNNLDNGPIEGPLEHVIIHSFKL